MHVGENTNNHCTDDPGCFLFLCSDHDKIAREEKEDRAQNVNTNSMVTYIGVDDETGTCEEGNHKCYFILLFSHLYINNEYQW